MDTPTARILESATRHFAEFGFDDASVRDIAGDAKVNPALINYYFRSKDDLYREVVMHSVRRLAEARVETLDELERKANGKAIPLQVLLAATTGPVFAESRVPGTDRQAYIRFMSRLFSNPGPETVAVIFGGLQPLRTRVFEALCVTLPHVPRAELAWRYLFLSAAVHFTTAQIGYVEVISGGVCQSNQLDEALANLLAAQTAMLGAPPAGPIERALVKRFAKPVAALNRKAAVRTKKPRLTRIKRASRITR